MIDELEDNHSICTCLPYGKYTVEILPRSNQVILACNICDKNINISELLVKHRAITNVNERIKQSLKNLNNANLTFTSSFNSISQEAHQTAKNKGFWEPVNDNLLNKVMGYINGISVWIHRLREAREDKLYLPTTYSLHKNNATEKKTIGLKLSLIIDEVVEALEVIENKEKFGEELADIVIRTMDLATHSDIDLGETILDKIEKNKSRPHKHNKKF